MRTHDRVLAAFLPALALACGGEAPLTDGLSTEATEAALLATETSNAWAESLVFADPLEDEDLTRSEQSYRRNSSCVQFTRGSGSLRLDFGPGCTYGDYTVSGALTVLASRGVGSSAKLDVVYEQLSAGARTVTGTTSLTWRSGQRDMSGDLGVSGSSTYTLSYASTLRRIPNGVSFDGVAAHDDGTILTDVDAQGLQILAGDTCPSAGTVTLERSGQPTTVVGFSSQTPSTGEVSVQVGRRPPTTVTVPACL